MLGIRKATMPINSFQMFFTMTHPHATNTRLCDEGGGSGALVPPCRGKGTDGLVVAGETVDTRLDENEAAGQC
jgi:hypothetical protein